MISALFQLHFPGLAPPEMSPFVSANQRPPRRSPQSGGNCSKRPARPVPGSSLSAAGFPVIESGALAASWSETETTGSVGDSAQRADRRGEAIHRNTAAKHRTKPARKQSSRDRKGFAARPMVIDPHQGSRCQSAPTSIANKAARNPSPTGVIQAGVFFSVKSHQPNQRMQSGIVTKIAPSTLMVLPINVASDARRPNQTTIGLMN